MTSTLPSPSAGQERDAFEAFMRDSRRNRGVKKAAELLNRFEDGTYINEHVQRHWWTWQQAQAALTSASKQEGGEPACTCCGCGGCKACLNGTAKCQKHRRDAAPQPPLAGAGEAAFPGDLCLRCYGTGQDPAPDDRGMMMKEAHRLGFLRAAGWTQRDDLFADVSSPAYRKDRDHDIAQIKPQPAPLNGGDA